MCGSQREVQIVMTYLLIMSVFSDYAGQLEYLVEPNNSVV